MVLPDFIVYGNSIDPKRVKVPTSYSGLEIDICSLMEISWQYYFHA